MKRLLLVLVMVSGFVYAETVEYGYFLRNSTTQPWTKSVTLNEGDGIIFLNGYKSNPANPSSDDCALILTMSSPQNNNISISKNYRFTLMDNELRRDNQRIFSGPCSITPNEHQDLLHINYKIIRASESSSSSSAEPINIVSLPADNNGDVDLLIETSPDLQTWTPIYSDSIGATGTATFIRTRLVTE